MYVCIYGKCKVSVASSSYLAYQVVNELQDEIGGQGAHEFVQQLRDAHIHTSTGATIAAAEDTRSVRDSLTIMTRVSMGSRCMQCDWCMVYVMWLFACVMYACIYVLFGGLRLPLSLTSFDERLNLMLVQLVDVHTLPITHFDS